MSFIGDYLTYAADTESPDMYNVWGGFTVLSAAVSRRVWFPLGKLTIYPNLYVMLVGDAGCTKSTVLHVSKSFLQELGVPLSRNVETPEGLWRYMNGEPKADPPIDSPVAFTTLWPDGTTRECHPMTIIAGEFINFIGKSQEGWMNALNEIYDEDNYEYRTKTKGEDNLTGPYIVLFGALTTDVSYEMQRQSIISTGFARRTIFQFGERKWDEPHAIPGLGVDNSDIRKRLIAYAKGLADIKGPFTWDTTTMEYWIKWYNKNNALAADAPPHLKSWLGTKATQVIKVAMLTSLSDNYELKLTITHLEFALDCFQVMERDLFKVLGGAGRNELAIVAIHILEYVKKRNEPVGYSEIERKFWTEVRQGDKDIESCINHLAATGQVVRGDAVGRAGQFIKMVGTPAVMQHFFARGQPPPAA